MATVFERVRKIIVDQLGVEEDQVVPSASFVDDLNADSLDLVELIMSMEEEFSKEGKSLEISDEDWHQGMEVYFLSAVRPIRLVAPIMAAQGGGAIVNISTAWAFQPSDMFPTSAVFRAGLASFTKIVADSYAAKNVRVNNVLPGWIDSLPATDERRDSVPMGRYGTAAEIAATIAFLLSDGAGYITGQNIRVDGGLIRSV